MDTELRFDALAKAHEMLINASKLMHERISSLEATVRLLEEEIKVLTARLTALQRGAGKPRLKH